MKTEHTTPFRRTMEIRAFCALLRLQFRAQALWYLLPPVFLYLLLLPSQLSLLAIRPLTDEILSRVLSLTREFVTLFGLWYQFLAFRILRYPSAREIVHACWNRRQKLAWSAANSGVYLLVTAPYLCCLHTAFPR